MSQEKSLLKNLFIYGIGNFGSRILTFILLPLYSYYLSTKEFGIYDLINASITLFIPIITLQITESVYRWLLDAKSDEQKQIVIISSGLFILINISAIFCILYYIVMLFATYEYSNYFPPVVLSTCYLIFFQQVARGLGKNKLYAVSGIITTLLILLLNTCFLVFFKLGIISLFIAAVVANLVAMVFICISAKVTHLTSLKHIQKQEMQLMLSYSWPLIPNAISWWLISVADKYITLYILGAEANGIYAVSSRFPAIISLFSTIFLLAWQDHGLTADASAESKAFFSKTFDRLFTFELTLVILLIAISPYLIKHFIDINFYESYKYIPLLYVGVAYWTFSVYMGVGYQKIKATREVFKTTIIGGIINVCISLFFMKYIGLYAPALGTFVSFSVIYLIRKYQTNKFFHIKVNNKKLTVLTCIALVYPVQYILNNEIYSLCSVLLAFVLFIFLNKELFLELFNTTKRPVKHIFKYAFS